MACDMVSLGTGRTAVLPLAGETEVAGALPADVIVAEVIVERLGIWEDLRAVDPLAAVPGGVVDDGGRDGGGGLAGRGSVLRRLGGLLLELGGVLGGRARRDGVLRRSWGRLCHVFGEQKVVWVEIAVESVLEGAQRDEGSWVGKTRAEHRPVVYKLWST